MELRVQEKGAENEDENHGEACGKKSRTDWQAGKYDGIFIRC